MKREHSRWDAKIGSGSSTVVVIRGVVAGGQRLPILYSRVYYKEVHKHMKNSKWLTGRIYDMEYDSNGVPSRLFIERF